MTGRKELREQRSRLSRVVLNEMFWMGILCLQMLDVPAMNDILFIVLKRLFYKSYHNKASYLATSALVKKYVLTYYCRAM